MSAQLLTRPDGVEIAWRIRGAGAGPRVMLAPSFMAVPETFAALREELAADHEILDYDLRGTGASTRSGAYAIDVDAGDIEAVCEAAGGVAAIVALGDAGNRAARVAAARPDLVGAVVCVGGNPLGRSGADIADGEALISSDGVLDTLRALVRANLRSALHTMLATGNPELSEAQVSERVGLIAEHCDHDGVAGRLDAWIADDATDACRACGERLLMLVHGTNPFFSGGEAEPIRRLLPEARVVEVADGPISRPDLSAAAIRELLAARAVGRS